MKTILKRKGSPAPIPASEPAPAPPKFTARGGSKKRILLAVTADGKIDFQSMSSEASKELNELLHTPEVQAQFNIGPLKDNFDPAHCKRIYQALGTVFQSIARLALKWPNEAAEKLLYTDQEQTELADPTAKVLDELAPKWLRENQSVVALGLVFGAITQAKLREAQLIIIEQAKQRGVIPVAAGAQPIAPAPVPSPEVMRSELHADMRKAGIKTTIATAPAPAPTPATQVTLGPSSGPTVPDAKAAGNGAA